jgi:CRP/FNR family transcriptional regulator, cyclic AMP receptor protein
MLVPNTLAAHRCFKTLDHDSCRVLDRACAWLKTPAGSWIVDQTANDRDVYFVLTGRLHAALQGTRQDVIFAQDLIFTDIEAGSFFGELSALEGAPHALSVLAVNDSVMAKMPAALFVETMFTHRPLGEAVVATLVARNREMTHRVAEAAHLHFSCLPYADPTRARRWL